MNFPDEIPSSMPIGPSSPLEEGEARGLNSNPAPFEKYMEEAGGKTGAPSKAMSPFELAQGAAFSQSTPTMATVMAQVNTAQSTLGDLNQNLNNKSLKLNNSQKYLLRHKIPDANSEIRSAAAKTGVELQPLPHVPANLGPLAKLVSYIDDGQRELASAHSRLKTMMDSGHALNPGQLLYIQTKLSRAQMLMEFSSVLLSKGVEAIKSLFSVQI